MLVRIRPGLPGLPTASFPLFIGLSRLRVRVPLQAWNRQVSRVPLPNFGVTSIGEACSASSKGITPPSLLLRTHAPNPLALPSFGIASFEESS